MRTISVKEAAVALSLTPRAIVYRLEKGDLKGTRSQNLRGVMEWRIYPNREISEKLRCQQNGSNSDGQQDEDIVDAHDMGSIDAEAMESSGDDARGSWLEVEREGLRLLAEEMTKPLVQTIREQERIIQDQHRQLRLLPDLEKRPKKKASPRNS